jgi:hypothetical protein
MQAHLQSGQDLCMLSVEKLRDVFHYSCYKRRFFSRANNLQVVRLTAIDLQGPVELFQ